MAKIILTFQWYFQSLRKALWVNIKNQLEERKEKGIKNKRETFYNKVMMLKI